MPRTDFSFDYVLRSITTAALSIGTVAVNLYLYVKEGTVPAELIGWSALILGYYFGAHATLNGRAQGQRLERTRLAAEVAAIETVQAAAGVRPPPKGG